MRIAVISGATSGMGRDFARVLAKEELDGLWLVGRREERLVALAEELAPLSCRLFVYDLTEKEGFSQIKAALLCEDITVSWLIAAAGCGSIGKFEEGEKERYAHEIDLNCRALTLLISCCLPHMEKGGRIVTLASAAAYLPQPGFAVYAATKAYVLHLSRALARELRPRGITVTAVCPGPVRTEFFTHAEAGGKKMPKGKEKYMQTSETVVCRAIRAAKKGRTVVTPSLPMKLARLGAKLLPHALLVRIFKTE